jgi:predicted HTH transcriptional regulator
MNPPTNEELLLWLRDPEHTFVERKVFSDSKDWLKTVVAFANSTPIDYPAVLYIGVRNDGEPEERTLDLDSIQKSLSEKVSAAYPTIYYDTKLLDVRGKNVLAVIVPGSPARPHFAGPAYVREGSKTVNASKEQFDQLIAQRNSKAYKILEWKGKAVKYGNIRHGEARPSSYAHGVVVDCNQHYVTLDLSSRISFPLDRIEISFDDVGNRLEVVLLPV